MMLSYCRLCAEYKEPDQMQSNVSDENVHTKLMYCFNNWTYYESYYLEFQEICIGCIEHLEQCYSFLKTIEYAQDRLREIQGECYSL